MPHLSENLSNLSKTLQKPPELFLKILLQACKRLKRMGEDGQHRLEEEENNDTKLGFVI